MTRTMLTTSSFHICVQFTITNNAFKTSGLYTKEQTCQLMEREGHPDAFLKARPLE